MKTNPGFVPDHLMTMNLVVPRAKYKEDAQLISFYSELVQRAKTVPGVQSASVVNFIPLGGSNSSDAFLVEGLPEPSPGQEYVGRYRVCTPDYFQTMGIVLLRGRDFTASDKADTAPVAIINETMARKYWTNGDAVGKRFRFMGAAGKETVDRNRRHRPGR
jgi:putative ABC transport system permease protein